MDLIQKAQITFGNILIAANRIQSIGDKLFWDLSLKQWFLLIVISNMPEKDLSINRIAEVNGTTRQNVRKMLELLRTKGYVELFQGKSDARALDVKLTDKTREFMKANEELGILYTRQLFEGIKEEHLDTVNDVCNKLFCNLENFRKQDDVHG